MPISRPKIYLDCNATAPLNARVRDTLWTNDLFNPSSIHSHGRRAKLLLAEAREAVARSLGPKVDSEQVVFTSSGTEANQLAIRSVLEPLLLAGKKPHWITTPIEHDSVLQMKEWLERRGGQCSFLPVFPDGRVDVSALDTLISSDTALVSLVWVNNETGVINDAGKLLVHAHQRGVRVHLDAVQAWGKHPFDLNELRPDFLTVSGHKIGALSGVGALWVNRGIPIQGTVLGKQEKGRRGGTENLMGCVSMGIAAQTLPSLDQCGRIAALRDRLQRAISERIPEVMINGQEAPRVCNTLNISLGGIEGEGLVMALDLEGYSVSAGSACASGALEPSHVLLAMGRTRQQALSAVRVSLSDQNTREELDGFVDALERVVERFRRVVR